MDIDGVVLESKYPEFQFLIKGPLQKMWRDGFPVEEHKIIALQFDRYLCELDVMAKNQEWTEEERESVARTIAQQLDDPSFRDMWVHEIPRPPKPWPTYDETPEAQIVTIATATGTVFAALAYEQRGREPRPAVLAKLEKLAEADEESPGEAEADEIFAA